IHRRTRKTNVVGRHDNSGVEPARRQNALEVWQVLSTQFKFRPDGNAMIVTGISWSPKLHRRPPRFFASPSRWPTSTRLPSFRGSFSPLMGSDIRVRATTATVAA